MLKTGGASSEKRMYKFAKRRVSFIIFIAIVLQLLITNIRNILVYYDYSWVHTREH